MSSTNAAPLGPGKAAANNDASAKEHDSFVTVACKVPNGFVLQCFERVDSTEPSPAGARTVEIARKVYESYTLNGPARPMTGAPAPYLIIGGYGLTPNIPKKVWEHWKRDNAEADIVKNGLIFAHEKLERVQSEAKDRRSIRSNMEPLDPDSKNADKSFKDPRMVRGIKKHEDTDMEAEASS